MEEETLNKIKELKDKAEYFLENDIKAFIKDKNDSWYFCDILLVGDIALTVYSFAGKKIGNKDRILWIDVEDIKEYKQEEKE